MSQTTLEQAAKWVSQAAGIDMSRDCQRAIDLTNDVRELIYQESSLVWNATLCVPLRCFCAPCGDTCNRAWAGVSLPAWVKNALAVWVDDRPMPIVDRWGIYPYEAEWSDRITFQAVDMGEGWPFMEDPPCGKCYRLGFLATSRADAGKKVEVRFVDCNNVRRVVTVELATTWQCVPYAVKRVEPSGISLALDLQGSVKAMDGDGKQLAEWQPWETVPCYRRFRLADNCCATGRMITIHGERQFHRLHHLADPVEIDQKLIWEDGYKHLSLHRKTNADAGDMANATRFAQTFKARIEAEARKSWGRAKRNAIRVPRRGGSGLLAKM